MFDTDTQNRQKALDVTQSFIVQAPAGSGKTTLLTQRYLALLNTVQDPEEILAITFTRKAAQEMQRRVLTTLDLDNPHRLRIQTIDSLCAHLAAQMPILSKLGTPPHISENPQELYEKAAKALLSTIEDNPPWQKSLETLLLHLDNQTSKVITLFCEMLGKRDQWLHQVMPFKSNTYPKQLLESGLKQAIYDTHQLLLQYCPVDIKNELPVPLPGVGENYHDAWLILANSLLTKENEWRAIYKKKNGFVEQTHTFRELLIHLRKLPPPTYSTQQWQILMAVLELLPILTAHLHLVFQETNQADYIEITQAALNALGESDNPTDLALTLDYRIRHILIDEFQDTSITQWHLLEKLTAGWQNGDGRTLFIVGDPMQSIYRFRKAEVGLFTQAKHFGIGNIDLLPLTLQKNFRSTHTLINFFNETFEIIFPKNTLLSEGAVAFTNSTSPLPLQEEQSGTEIIYRALENESQEIQTITQQILTLQRQDPTCAIAMLVRSRSHLKNILPALKQAGITYHAVDIEKLSEQSVIQDLLALTRALLHPADRIAWLAILRAPWCGLSLAELHALVAEHPEKTVWECLKDNNERNTRLQRILPIIETALENRQRLSLAHSVEGLWQALGGPACLENTTELKLAENFFQHLSRFDYTVDVSMLEEKLQQLYAEYSFSKSNTTPIEIMTIHKAKGLEFDAVILPSLHRTISSDSPSLLLCNERPNLIGKTDLLFAPIKSILEEKDAIYDYLAFEEKRRAEQETKRLLYVAFTRAKKTLYCSAVLKKSKQGIKTPSRNTLLGHLWPALEKQFMQAMENSSISITNTQDLEKSEKKLKRLSLNWQAPFSPQMKNIRINTPNLRLTTEEDASKKTGTLIHRYLQLLAQIGLENWSFPSYQKIKSDLSAAGVGPEVLETETEKVTQVFNNLHHDPRAQWIFKPHLEARTEWPLTAVLDNQISSVVIDRTFIDEQGKRWIIDYKITKEADALLHRDQLEKYAKILKLTEKKSIFLGLYFPLIPEWKEWEFIS